MKRTNTIERILESFLPDFTEEKTTHEIMEKTQLSYEPVYRHLKNMAKQDIVTKKRKGKTDLFRLNLENDEIRKTIEKWSIKKRKKFLHKFTELKPVIEELINSIESLGPYLLSLILFGSVARGSATKKSDIDILIVISIEDQKDHLTDEIHRICNILGTKYNKELSPMIVSLGDFYKMLEEKKDFTKNMIKDAIVLYGEEIFYRELIKRFRKWQLKTT